MLYGVSFSDINNGTVVGRAGTILRTTNGGTSFIEIGNEGNEIPSKCIILQNYPNPFNPTTTIRYQISERSFVTIKVYDVLGSEVTMPINEEKSIGSYELEFNGSKLPSGIYFYQIKTGNFVETKKMILLK